jgi:hypothetical protein
MATLIDQLLASVRRYAGPTNGSSCPPPRRCCCSVRVLVPYLERHLDALTGLLYDTV